MMRLWPSIEPINFPCRVDAVCIMPRKLVVVVVIFMVFTTNSGFGQNVLQHLDLTWNCKETAAKFLLPPKMLSPTVFFSRFLLNQSFGIFRDQPFIQYKSFALWKRLHWFKIQNAKLSGFFKKKSWFQQFDGHTHQNTTRCDLKQEIDFLKFLEKNRHINI